MSDWTPAATDLTTLLWADGKSASEISRVLWDRLGFYASRNAVIGKVHRLRLPARARRDGPKTTKAWSRKGARKAAAVLAAASVAGRRAKPPARVTRPAKLPKPKAIPPEAPTPMNLTLMDLTSRTCKWPVNDPPRGEPFLFCGAVKEPGIEPYCPYHARLATGPGTESERRAYRPYREMARASA